MLAMNAKYARITVEREKNPNTQHEHLINDSPYYVFVALCIVVIVVSLIFKMAYFLS
jgi:hypothetical protein